MGKTTLEDLFKDQDNNFDVETPDNGHKTRFLDKLNRKNEHNSIVTRSKTPIWKPFVGIAASIALLASLFIFNSRKTTEVHPDLASISPEMAKTETLFMATLSNELKKLNSEDMPEYQELIVEALFQIKVLEEEYNQLILALRETPDDELVLSAMILNFQSRIDVLQETKDNIKDLKKTPKTIHVI